MKKIIAGIIAAALVLSGGAVFILHGGIDEGRPPADGSCNIRAAVLGSGERAQYIKKQLENGIMGNIELTDKADMSGADIVYVSSLDKTASGAIEEFVYKGGTAVLDNSTLSGFSKEFLGASELVPLGGCPAFMTYNEPGEDIGAISELLYDYTEIFRGYENYDSYAAHDYGYGIVPTTAEAITELDGAAVYTHNIYGEGNVFITNPMLPSDHTVSDFKPGEDGEPFAAATAAAGNLLLNYYAEFASKQKYGFAVERSFGAFGTKPAAWELHYEDITGIENNSLEEFARLCIKKGQMPSYTLARNFYTWFDRSESLSWLENDNGIKNDIYEGAYCSGRHVVSSGKWLTQDRYEHTESYFDDDPKYTKRLYPYPTDWNDDGVTDFICGSADGRFYYYEGRGMKDNYETGVATLFTDRNGNALTVGAYSSPVVFDIDGDGRGELISGAEDGIIRYYESMKDEDNRESMAFELGGVVLDTGLTDSMIDIGDLTGDGFYDLAVGSRSGELRVYPGFTRDGWTTSFEGYISVNTGESRAAPCIYNGELYCGTLEGRVARFTYDGSSFNKAGYLKYNDISRRGDDSVTIGMNCVPRFTDIDGDGDDDLLCGSLEYGMAYPIDSGYFPYREKLQEQIDFCKNNNIYLGIHGFTSRYATPEHEAAELDMHKRAFEKYGLEWNGKGANQHTWYTSMYGYDGSGINGHNPGYNGTFTAQKETGLLWNSGFTPPESRQVPQSCAENAIPMPMYLSGMDFLLMQVSNTPHGDGRYSYQSVKYNMPMLFYNHCDYIYEDENEQTEAVDKVEKLVDNYGYLFTGEDVLARMISAAYNTDISAQKDGDRILVSAAPRDKSRGLYDADCIGCVGARIVFSDRMNAEGCTSDSAVSRAENGSITVSLEDTAMISKTARQGLDITGVNLPAEIKRTDKGARISFKKGGLMIVRVRGEASAPEGWAEKHVGDETLYMKFGNAETVELNSK